MPVKLTVMYAHELYRPVADGQASAQSASKAIDVLLVLVYSQRELERTHEPKYHRARSVRGHVHVRYRTASSPLSSRSRDALQIHISALTSLLTASLMMSSLSASSVARDEALPSGGCARRALRLPG